MGLAARRTEPPPQPRVLLALRASGAARAPVCAALARKVGWLRGGRPVRRAETVRVPARHPASRRKAPPTPVPARVLVECGGALDAGARAEASCGGRGRSRDRKSRNRKLFQSLKTDGFRNAKNCFRALEGHSRGELAEWRRCAAVAASSKTAMPVRWIRFSFMTVSSPE